MTDAHTTPETASGAGRWTTLILTWLPTIPVAIAYGTATNNGYCAAYVLGSLVLLLPAATFLNHEQDALT